ncbi:MAG: ZIP family metal transporter [Candidatus Veblenbacteria bacterium]|nr:ZIP family metal transporter [Candidatus Veblenbacteria bacterium]
MPWFPTIVSVLVVSLISFVGVFAFSLSVPTLKRLMFILISFAAGTLLGDTFIHILPELVEEVGFELKLSLWLLGAFILFYVLENGIHWHHYHHVAEEDRHPVGTLNLVGDGFHNLIDGLIIGASYLVDIKLGFATTLAVIFHEIPQEIGDYAILIHSGFKRSQALLFNFLSAMVAVVGAVLALWFSQAVAGALPALLALTAGGFIYIATVDLIPELHKEVRLDKSALQLLFLVAGVALMVLLSFLE